MAMARKAHRLTDLITLDGTRWIRLREWYRGEPASASRDIPRVAGRPDGENASRKRRRVWQAIRGL